MKINEIILVETYSAYVLSKKSRAEILKTFPPKFSIVNADHVTVKFGLSKEDCVPRPAKIEVVGYASDDSLEAAVVSVNGKTQRSDGSSYHVTLSYEPNRKPVQSNGLISNGWDSVKPFSIQTKPEILR